MSDKKILVVDDDPDVCLGLQVRLNANHYDVVCAGDGVTSISEARKHMPDLMRYWTWGCPPGDGFSVLERMKGNEKLASIPVIVLSGRRTAPAGTARSKQVRKRFCKNRRSTGSCSPSFD